MRTNLAKNLSANTVQLVINQLAGLVIYYILSVHLSKSNFGQINLALAILLAAFNILSFGIDQIIVRKIASGEDRTKFISLYLVHVVITGLIFYCFLIVGRVWISSDAYSLVLALGIGKLAIFFSTPFKQSAIGMERFKLLARMSVVSNISRAIALLVLILEHNIELQVVIIVFISGDVLELAAAFYLFKRKTGLPKVIQWDPEAYKTLIQEALPQLGVVVITSGLARFDWIFIGLFVSAVKLAEYSFAYKVFELSTLPLLALAPILIPLFTRMFKNGVSDTENLKLLIRVEMIVAAFTVLLLNICWTPVIDPLTAGKYGDVNRHTIFILSLCIPLQFFCNFFWNIYFAKGQLKLILKAFILTFIVNIAGDLILIPLYHNEGAAIACLGGFVVQAIYYLARNEVKGLTRSVVNLAASLTIACGSFFLAKAIFNGALLSVIFSVSMFAVLLLATAQIRPADLKKIRSLF